MSFNQRMMVSVLLASLAACGGGGGGGGTSPQPPGQKATGLTYTDPATSEFKLVKDAASTSTKVVLSLVGPASATGRGVSFTLVVDPSRVDLVKVADVDAEYVQNGAVFALGSAPQILKGIKQDGILRVTVAQKGAGSAKALNASLLKVAIQFKSNADLLPGTSLPIAVTEGQYLPAIGGPVATPIATGSLETR